MPKLPLAMNFDAWAPLKGYEPVTHLTEALAFIYLGNGDVYFADGGRAILFDHETRSLTNEADLREFLNSYFLGKAKYG